MKKTKTPLILTITGVLSAGVIVALMIMADNDRKNLKINQENYESKLSQITDRLNEFDCDGALDIYNETKILRDELSATRLYFSIETHAQQANEIGIAECFAYQKEFDSSIKLLHIDDTTNPDYLRRAAAIYKLSGDIEKSNEALQEAAKFIE